MEILKKLTSFNAACKIEGLDPKKVLPDFKYFPKKDRKSMINHAMLVIIVAAANRLANGGKPWKVNFDDYNQWKYEARFYKEKRGGSSGFRFLDYDRWASSSSVGSRLCFINREVAACVAKRFIKLYNGYLL